MTLTEYLVEINSKKKHVYYFDFSYLIKYLLINCYTKKYKLNYLFRLVYMKLVIFDYLTNHFTYL